MLKTPQTLAQVYLTSTSLTDVYTAPKSAAEGRVTEVTMIWLCNQATAAVTVRASIGVAGAADANKQYLAYDYSIPANNAVDLLEDKPLFLPATDVLRIKASAASSVSVTVQGFETT